MESKSFVFIYFFVLTVGNSIIFLYGKAYNVSFLIYAPFVFLSIFIFIGLMSYSRAMVPLLLENKKYLEMIEKKLFNHALKPIFGVITALPFAYYDYNVFAFLIILASFGEMVLQKRVENELENSA